MDQDGLFGELELEEAEFRSLNRVEDGNDTILLKNDAKQEADGAAIASYLGQVRGIERIESLVVAPNSQLKDLMVIKAFPRLINLQVNGLQIRSLDGLEWFRQGRHLNIDTGANQQRSIAKLNQAPIAKLSLQYAGEQDFEAIAGSSTIRHLELAASPCPPFAKWQEVPLEILSLSKSSCQELADTARLPGLKKMTLLNCRSLARLTGDNSIVTWLVIQGCSQLDLRTIATCRGLEYLFVIGNQTETALSDLVGLERLKEISLERCKVQVKVADLKSAMPLLEKIHISGLREDEALELSRVNADLSVSTERHTYLNGGRSCDP